MSSTKYHIPDDVIKRLSEAIDSIGLTKVAIAKKIGMKPTRISDVLAKRYRVPFQLLEGLYVNYGISIDYIINGKQEKKVFMFCQNGSATE